MVYKDHILHTYSFLHCLDTGLQKNDKALLIQSSQSWSVSEDALEPHGIFSISFATLGILRLSSV